MPHCFMPLAASARKGMRARKGAFLPAFVAASALMAAVVTDYSAHAAFGGISALAPPAERHGARLNPPADVQGAGGIAAAVRQLSGSPFTGIVDCLLERNMSEKGPGVHISYPSIGITDVDEDIRQWVVNLADAFAEHLDLTATSGSLDLDVFDPDAILAAPPLPDSGAFELWGGYRVSRPSEKAVSIAFEIWNYTGQPEGNLDILTLNYSLLTGQRLNFIDIFEKPDIALKLMSDWSRKTLEPRLGAARPSSMLNDGTEPLLENFSSFTLTPEGICINFQPWQVAPLDAGIQQVAMPLEELLPSAPLLALWGKSQEPEKAEQ